MNSKVTVSAIEGNTQYLDGGAMFGNAPRVVWEKWHPCDKQGRIELATRALLVECAGTLFLCETGIGNFFPAHLATRYGIADHDNNRTLSALAAHGVDPADIDYVILSHLHFDHAGGLLTRNGQLNFPAARYVVGKKAFARACSPHPRDRASFIAELPQKLQDSGRLMLVDSSTIAGIDNLEFIFTDGHTPGQMHAVFHGNEQKIFFAGDLIPGAAWVHLPITAGYDRFPEKLIDEKHELYKRAEPENWLIFFMHDPKIRASRIIKGEKGRYVATDTRTDFQRYSL